MYQFYSPTNDNPFQIMRLFQSLCGKFLNRSRSIILSLATLLLLTTLVACGGGGGGGGGSTAATVTTVDVDIDNDGVENNVDACDGPDAATDWTSDSTTDRDGDGCRDSDEDAFDDDPTENADTDGDGTGDNADAFPNNRNENTDTDSDGTGDNADVDVDGNGLIEIASAQQLNQTRHNLQGSSFKINATDAGNTNGCGGLPRIRECNGYELVADISLANYADWKPIGSCPVYSSFICTDTASLFNTIFDGNDYIISNLTITNSDGNYDNAVGLFGATSTDALFRNVHIRSANITGGGHNVGMLVGNAGGATISHSSAEGKVAASGANVGGLIGDGFQSTITSSYAKSVSVSGNTDGADLLFVSFGGLVGFAAGATITSSYAISGSVNGINQVGGLVGNGNSATITSSYAMSGSLNAIGASGENQGAGGLVGFLLSGITITSSYAVSGNIRGGNGGVGGLIGDGGESESIITDSYWDNAVTVRVPNFDDNIVIHTLADNRGEAKTTNELQGPTDPDIYTTWTTTCADGSRAWDFGNLTEYPALTCTFGDADAQRE